jgi:hypothetical protein
MSTTPMKTHEDAATIVKRLRKRWDDLPEVGEPRMPIYDSELKTLEALVAENEEMKEAITKINELATELHKCI